MNVKPTPNELYDAWTSSSEGKKSFEKARAKVKHPPRNVIYDEFAAVDEVWNDLVLWASEAFNLTSDALEQNYDEYVVEKLMLNLT